MMARVLWPTSWASAWANGGGGPNKTGASGIARHAGRGAPAAMDSRCWWPIQPVFYAHHIFAKVPYDIRKDFGSSPSWPPPAW